jgi:hypothetical protein
MPSRTKRQSQGVRKSAERVSVPANQERAKRLPPSFALAWMHLLPNAVFPIRSKADMAAKLSALILSEPSFGTQKVRHKLPAASQQDSLKRTAGR